MKYHIKLISNIALHRKPYFQCSRLMQLMDVLMKVVEINICNYSRNVKELLIESNISLVKKLISFRCFLLLQLFKSWY